MTEDQWLAATDPEPMIEFVRDRASERKLRLFCCACCRHVWELLGRGRREAVEIGERYADGTAGWWGSFRGEALTVVDTSRPEERAVNVVVNRWPLSPGSDGPAAALLVARLTRGDDPTGLEAAAQADFLRDVIGPFPFRVRWPWQRRGLNVAAGWLTSTVVSLAEGIYAARAFDRLPILADALQDAGCASADVLGHCRGPGPHVRGCWVVDRVLGKG